MAGIRIDDPSVRIDSLAFRIDFDVHSVTVTGGVGGATTASAVAFGGSKGSSTDRGLQPILGAVAGSAKASSADTGGARISAGTVGGTTIRSN